jgi:hypothetical protein
MVVLELSVAGSGAHIDRALHAESQMTRSSCSFGSVPAGSA